MSGALLDLDAVADRSRVEDEVDVVVVGTGAGGAAAGRVLAAAGLEVAFVEEGPFVPVHERRADAWTSFRQHWRDLSFQVAKGRAFTPVLQGVCVGGSTTIYGAIIHRMPEAIHDVWAREWGLGDTLPYAALERAWDRLDEELSVAPTPEEVWGRNNALMKQGLDALGWSGGPTRRAVVGCQGSARCNQGCPTARKQSMDVTLVPRAMDDGARLYADARVERVLVQGGRAVGVRARFRSRRTGRTGPSLTVRARHAVVVAAGAIHTPLLLATAGVGKRSGLLGERLQCHPGTSILATFDEPVEMWRGATQGYETTHFWHERMKFETVGVPPEIAAARLPGFGADLVRATAEASHVASWGVQVRAEAMGRVRRGLGGRPSIRYSMRPGDVRVLKRGLRRLGEVAFAAGAREVLPGVHGLPERVGSVEALDAMFDLPDDPRLVHCICAHLFGTAAMGPDDRRGVLDPEGRTWEVAGLYAMDAAALPTNMGVNPAHTISAVAWLQAERLADRLTG